MNNGLTSFRFFAFFAVFLYHFGILEFGYMGVHAFFVLSGYLLTPILLDMKNNLSTKDYFTHFYGRRALRIFPLYFFYLLMLFFIAYIGINFFDYDLNDRLAITMKQLVYALTYTYNFHAMTSSYQLTETLSHVWSLAVEEQFYLIWPLVLMYLPAHRIKIFLLILVLVGPLVRALVAYSVFIWPESFNRLDLSVYAFTFSSFDAFAIGGLFALYVKSIKWSLIFIFTFILLLLGITTEIMNTGNLNFTSLGYQSFMSDSYKFIWAYSVFSILFGALIIKVRNAECLPWMMEHKVFVYLGTISYGLYIYHFPILYFMQNELSSLSGYLRLIIILSTSIIIAGLSYHFLEKPFLMKKDAWFNRHH